jgi:photosystem II stability/assembly factor-like uncharacterized protein
VDGNERLLFGHHDGVLESRDGGRSWQPLSARTDAMSLAVDGSWIVIAGHYVLQESRDGGMTWTDIQNDLPNTDIHAFARSPVDPVRMWAYLAEGGLYESHDGGGTWQKVYDDHITQLAAVVGEGGDALIGLDPSRGLARSDDGGRSWTVLSTPPLAPITSLAATSSGQVVLLGGPRGLLRSDDSGRNWRQILDVGTVLAVALTDDGQTVGAVTADTSFYRSDDGGQFWRPP